MISDNVNFATIDLEDFYLGTPLPHSEFIRIPTRFIPPKVVAFYKLRQYIHKGALIILRSIEDTLWSTASGLSLARTTF